jgi:outer membrane immunogenic protein
MLKLRSRSCLAKALIFAAVALGSSFAVAADMSESTPVYTKAPPRPAWSWGGFYIGSNVGYGFASADGDVSVLEPSSPPFPPPPFPLLNTTDADKLRGVFGGVQAGYNWQARNFLLGIETDVQASGQRSSNNFNAIIPSGFVSIGNDPVAVTDKTKLDWFGTTRGRLGIASDRWLVYVTGGVAYGEINENGNAQPANPFAGISNAPFVWNQTTTKVGWTLGAGIENAISANWSWKVEYLYIDLGNITSNVSGGVGNCYGAPGGGACSGSNPAFGSVSSRFTDNAVRVGVNYKFN